MALLSPVAVDAAYGATRFDHNEALIARAMAEHARQAVVLADYSKIGIRSRESYCDASRIDLLVTNNNAVERPGDKELAAEVGEIGRAACRERGGQQVELSVVPVSVNKKQIAKQ